jgi:hypothetical protein
MGQPANRGRPSGKPPRKRPSITYRSFWKAVRDRKQVTCVYDGLYREVCPIILGYASDAQEAVFVFQFGGESSQTLPAGGNWRCFRLRRVVDVRLRTGEWHSGTRHSKPQACNQYVDVDANIPETLTRGQPLAFGAPELRPPRRSP